MSQRDFFNRYLGTLRLRKAEQFKLDVTFDKNTPVDFFVQGPNSVHLIGNYLVGEESAPRK